jgi:hypothetical protein
MNKSNNKNFELAILEAMKHPPTKIYDSWEKFVSDFPSECHAFLIKINNRQDHIDQRVSDH